MPDNLSTPFAVAEDKRLRMAPGAGVEAEAPPTTPLLYSDEELLELWSEIREETLDQRQPFETQWRRNIYYMLNRQWLEYITGRGWRDKRMAQWIPRPVTNKCKVTVQAIRAMFSSVKLGVNVRPQGTKPENVSAASTADELAPTIHDMHHMTQCLSEFDYWLCVTGNAFFHTFVDYDVKHGFLSIRSEECVVCGTVTTEDKLAGPQPTCPTCGGVEFQPALDELGEPIIERRVKGKPTTLVLSPLELAFSNNAYARFEDVPYVVRLRWRTKRYMMANPALKPLAESGRIVWEKAPHDQNLSLFQQMASHNDVGLTHHYMSEIGSSTDEDGITEYEVWLKPTDTYPDGLVFRVYGQKPGIIAHLEETEAIPGPLPYRDADGNPLFTFAHAGYDPVGGRILASGPLDAIISKQDDLNRLDSMILLIIQRMSNPVWLTPKGAEIQKFTGMPGLVLRWNPLTVGGNAKPERIAGEGPHPTLFQIRKQYEQDIEELAGTFSVLKGDRPPNVEAFSAIQSLIELSHSRFSTVFQARGEAYKNWFKFAIELEREFGPDELTKAVLTPARQWTFKNFKRAQLQGSMTIIVEDGSTVPKTNLGMRAAVEHANGLGMLNMQDPDQQYEGLKLFGLQRMVPTLDIQVQSALQKQQAFEEWVVNPTNLQQFAMQAHQKQQAYEGELLQAQAQLGNEMADPMAPPQPQAPLPQPPALLEGTPLEYLPWFNPIIHKQEFIKWANDDRVRELLATVPATKQLLILHMQDLDMAMMNPMMGMGGMTAPPPPGGASMAMPNSAQNSAGVGPKSSGSGGTAEPGGTGSSRGPA